MALDSVVAGLFDLGNKCLLRRCGGVGDKIGGRRIGDDESLLNGNIAERCANVASVETVAGTGRADDLRLTFLQGVRFAIGLAGGSGKLRCVYDEFIPADFLAGRG